MHGGQEGGLQQLAEWLWARPAHEHSAEEDNDETVEDLLEEITFPELGVQGRHSSSLRMTSQAVPADISLSGRLYQTAQHSALEFSGPTMSTKSLWSSWSSSPRPLQRSRAPWPMSLTLTASPLHSLPRSTSSKTLKMEEECSPPPSSTGRNGSIPLKINSESSTRGTGRAQQLVASGSRSGWLPKAQNR
ncbi:movement protein [Dregea volubilis polerovirus 1]|nr:movement protein [Dregea volubilis polerovirus 1]